VLVLVLVLFVKGTFLPVAARCHDVLLSALDNFLPVL